MDYKDLKEILNRDKTCGNKKIENATRNVLSALNKLEIQSTKAKAGEFYSINTAKASGHISEIGKRTKKNYDTFDVITLTHAEKTRGRKNIKLEVNPNKNDFKDSHVVIKPNKVKNERKEVGKRHDDIRITNPQDKAVVRHIKNEAKRSNKKRQDYR